MIDDYEDVEHAIKPFDIASRFQGICDEVDGEGVNPHIFSMLHLDQEWPKDDEVPWCSAFVNYVAFLSNVTRSKSLMARSWLKVGVSIDVMDAVRGYDVVVMSRGGGNQPGPDIINAPGHVGFFSHFDSSGNIYVLGGNQNDSVNVKKFGVELVLSVRRLMWSKND